MGQRFRVRLEQARLDAEIPPGLLHSLQPRLQSFHEGFEEGLQTRLQAVQQARWDLGIQTRLLQADTKTLAHRPPPSVDVLQPRGFYANDLQPIRPTTQ